VVQKVLRGRDSLKKTPEMMEKLEMKKPLIVGGKHLAPKLKSIPELADAPVFDGYHPNPDLADAETGAEMIEEYGCDGIISIGGGSAIDTAKAVKGWALAGSVEKLKQNEYGDGKLPHIAIPGTAGSGAEATANAVLYENDQKSGLSDERLLPEGVVLDAGLLESLPEYHKKSCALDALCQGIESFWAKAATPDSRVHAYLAFRGVMDNLKAYLEGDSHAAEQMLDASYQSGKAIYYTRTTAAHAMSYQLTKLLGVAHGHACMMTLPALWDMLADNEEKKPMMAELAAQMGLGDARMGSRLLRGILLELDMPTPEMPDKETIEKLVHSVNMERLSNHPMELTEDDIRRVYRMAFAKVPENEAQACRDIWRYYGR